MLIIAKIISILSLLFGISIIIYTLPNFIRSVKGFSINKFYKTLKEDSYMSDIDPSTNKSFLSNSITLFLIVIVFVFMSLPLFDLIPEKMMKIKNSTVFYILFFITSASLIITCINLIKYKRSDHS